MQIFSIRQFLIESLDLGETEYRSNESKRSILSHVNFGRFMPISDNNITKHDFVGIPVYESVSLNSYHKYDFKNIPSNYWKYEPNLLEQPFQDSVYILPKENVIYGRKTIYCWQFGKSFLTAVSTKT